MEPIKVAGPIVTGIGTYTEITDIFGPAEAGAGSRVDITARIKNLYSSEIGIMVGGALEYGVTPWPTITFPTDWDNVAAGASKDFAGYFTMPASDVTVHIYSYYYGGDGLWHFDDQRLATIKLVTEPVFSNLSVSYRRVD